MAALADPQAVSVHKSKLEPVGYHGCSAILILEAGQEDAQVAPAAHMSSGFVISSRPSASQSLHCKNYSPALTRAGVA